MRVKSGANASSSRVRREPRGALRGRGTASGCRPQSPRLAHRVAVNDLGDLSTTRPFPETRESIERDHPGARREAANRATCALAPHRLQNARRRSHVEAPCASSRRYRRDGWPARPGSLERRGFAGHKVNGWRCRRARCEQVGHSDDATHYVVDVRELEKRVLVSCLFEAHDAAPRRARRPGRRGLRGPSPSRTRWTSESWRRAGLSRGHVRPTARPRPWSGRRCSRVEGDYPLSPVDARVGHRPHGYSRR